MAIPATAVGSGTSVTVRPVSSHSTRLVAFRFGGRRSFGAGGFLADRRPRFPSGSAARRPHAGARLGFAPSLQSRRCQHRAVADRHYPRHRPLPPSAPDPLLALKLTSAGWEGEEAADAPRLDILRVSGDRSLDSIDANRVRPRRSVRLMPDRSPRCCAAPCSHPRLRGDRTSRGRGGENRTSRPRRRDSARARRHTVPALLAHDDASVRFSRSRCRGASPSGPGGADRGSASVRTGPTVAQSTCDAGGCTASNAIGSSPSRAYRSSSLEAGLSIKRRLTRRRQPPLEKGQDRCPDR
jgi:hypothetical protein